MNELLTDIAALYELYATSDDPVALYATLEPLVNDGALSTDTANAILDYADALHNANAVLADVEALRAVSMEVATEREAERVRVPRWMNEHTVTTASMMMLTINMIVALAVMLAR